MEPIVDVRLSFERRRVRRRAVIMLASLGEATASQLARAAGIPRSRVRAVMEGRLPSISPERSPVGLGLASVRVSRDGRVYAISPRGMRHARRLTSRWQRLSRKRFMLET